MRPAATERLITSLAAGWQPTTLMLLLTDFISAAMPVPHIYNYNGEKDSGVREDLSELSQLDQCPSTRNWTRIHIRNSVANVASDLPHLHVQVSSAHRLALNPKPLGFDKVIVAVLRIFVQDPSILRRTSVCRLILPAFHRRADILDSSRQHGGGPTICKNLSWFCQVWSIPHVGDMKCQVQRFDGDIIYLELASPICPRGPWLCTPAISIPNSALLSSFVLQPPSVRHVAVDATPRSPSTLPVSGL